MHLYIIIFIYFKLSAYHFLLFPSFVSSFHESLSLGCSCFFGWAGLGFLDLIRLRGRNLEKLKVVIFLHNLLDDFSVLLIFINIQGISFIDPFLGKLLHMLLHQVFKSITKLLSRSIFFLVLVFNDGIQWLINIFLPEWNIDEFLCSRKLNGSKLRNVYLFLTNHRLEYFHWFSRFFRFLRILTVCVILLVWSNTVKVI